MPKMGSANAAFTPYQCFQCEDRYIFVGVTNEKFWQAFCNALELEKMAKDQRFSSVDRRLTHRDELIDELSSFLIKFPAAEILRKLEDAGVPCAPVAEIPEVLENPQALSRQMFIDMDYPGMGKLKIGRLPGRASGIEPATPLRAPRLGEHTGQIMLELGYSEIDIDSLAGKGVILRD
jgi:formyl-CoA transferase